jgi:hypothetical protein
MSSVKAARFCAFGALVRAGYDLTGDADQARRLAGQAAIFITGQPTPEEAYEEIYSLNDGPPVGSRMAILELFDKSLLRV